MIDQNFVNVILTRPRFFRGLGSVHFIQDPSILDLLWIYYTSFYQINIGTGHDHKIIYIKWWIHGRLKNNKRYK